MITFELSANTAAVASAIAASFSALAATLMLVIQRRSFVEAARPELVITGWNRTTQRVGDNERDIVSFQEVRNVGKGPALGVHMNVLHGDTDAPTAVMSTSRIPILGPGDSDNRGWEITLWWQNARDRHHLAFEVSMLCWDSRNRKYNTTYSAFAVPVGTPVGLPDETAPGLSVPLRRVRVVPIWHLKLKRALFRKRSFPRFGRKKLGPP